MNVRFSFRLPVRQIAGLAMLLYAFSLHAEPFRITTWDLQPSFGAGTNGWSGEFQKKLVQEAADSLKKLNPDVIVLQQITGWETCRQLAQALRPENYQVTVCSAFRDPRTKLLGRQVAILSKAKAFISWSEAWQAGADSPGTPGGFAFAAIRFGDKTVGVFSVQLDDASVSSAQDSHSAPAQQAREEAAGQLVKQIASLQNWKNNRPESFVVAGDFNTSADDLRLAHEKTLSRLEQDGFDNAFAGLSLEQRVTLRGDARRSDATMDYIFTRDAGVTGGPLITPTTLAEHAGVTCELDPAAPRRLPAPPPQVARAEATPVAPGGNPNLPWLLAGIFAGGLVFFLLAWKLGRRTQPHPVQAALPEAKAKTLITFAGSNSDKVIVAPPLEIQPFVHIEIGGSTQTQSQSWASQAEAGQPTAQMPEVVRAGVIANLSRWLKQKFVRQLVADRSHLIATQQVAALKVLAVDERLTKIEQQIQQRNQEYEKRIDALQQELLTAKEENRELIRAKIALVKAEMEKARQKVAQSGAPHQHN